MPYKSCAAPGMTFLTINKSRGIMTRKVQLAFLSVLLLLGFVLGCDSGQPELKVDPALAKKPFPKTGGRQVP